MVSAYEVHGLAAEEELGVPDVGRLREHRHQVTMLVEDDKVLQRHTKMQNSQL